MNKAPLAIRIDNFKELISGNFYYIDKTQFIKDIIDNNSKVSLILRPRRCGKNLNLSMLRYFFDCTHKKENLFTKLLIWKQAKSYQNQFAKYPVIFISFKEVKANDWSNAYKALKVLILSNNGEHNDNVTQTS